MKNLHTAAALIAANVVLSSNAVNAATATDVNIADRAVATLKIPRHPDFLAADGDSVWVLPRN